MKESSPLPLPTLDAEWKSLLPRSSPFLQRPDREGESRLAGRAKGGGGRSFSAQKKRFPAAWSPAILGRETLP